MRVICLRGISGSGKSTVARRLAAEVAGAVVVSSDDHFMIDGEYRFDIKKINAAHDACFRAFMDAIQAKAPLVIVDNTNSRLLEVAPYMMAGRAYGYDCSILLVACDVEVALARTIHGTPPEVNRAMADRIANLKIPPWWTQEVLHVEVVGEEVDSSE